jgi:hypothetical protein
MVDLTILSARSPELPHTRLFSYAKVSVDSIIHCCLSICQVAQHDESNQKSYPHPFASDNLWEKGSGEQGIRAQQNTEYSWQRRNWLIRIASHR